MHCARFGSKKAPRKRRPKTRRTQRLWYVSPDGFRELRLSCLLTQRACADLLGVCLRTVRHWDAGRNRVPWSAVRLLRILRAGELPASGFDGWRVQGGGRLVSPEGRVFLASDMAWWSLTCQMAQDWRRQRSATRVATARPSAAEGLPAGSTVADGGALDLAARPESDARLAASAPGRVPSATLPLKTVFHGAGDERGTAQRGERSEPRAPAATGLVPTKNNEKVDRGDGGSNKADARPACTAQSRVLTGSAGSGEGCEPGLSEAAGGGSGLADLAGLQRPIAGQGIIVSTPTGQMTTGGVA